MLRAAIEAGGWSYRTLEEASGIPRSTINAVVTGRNQTVPADTLRPIARALGLDWEAVWRAELASRESVWQLPARAQGLSPAGRRALIAHLDLLLELERSYGQR
jgi:transcriptional regulator with XRE-family HTH domain